MRGLVTAKDLRSLGRVNLDRRSGRLLVSFGTTLTRLEATVRPEHPELRLAGSCNC